MATARRSAHIPALRSALVAVILCMVAQRTVAAMCGDGLREDGEQCEDGNTNSGDGCSSSCQCEADPCRFTVASASVNLASVVTALAPGATVTLAAGTYAGDGSCGWSVPSLNGTDERSITVRGAAQGRVIIDCAQRGPVVEEAVRGTHLRLENLDLTNAHRSGGGGAVVQAERGSNIELVKCRVTNAASDGEGGAVLVSNSSLRVSGSHFEENSAVSGGALAIVDGSAALLEDTTVTHCFATSGGGGAYVARKSTLDMQGMHFSLNDGGPFGGALHSTAECTVQASTTTMTGNTATRAGAIRFDGGGVLRLTNGVHIIRNVAVYAGGIYVYGFGPETKIFDATGVTEVSKNIGRGGLSTNILVYTTTEAPCIVTFASDVRIRDGWAENYGAGLVAMNAIVHLRDGTTVAGNIAGVEGAGILALQVTLIVSGRVTIEDNHGLGILPGTGEIQKNAGGGGIWWASGWGVALLSSGVILRGNSCINGGAFFCEGLGSDSVLLDDVSFTDNFARFDGAGAFLSDSDASIRNVLFRNNTALANGGGLSFQGGMDASVSSCSFVANKALNGGGLAAAASSSIIHVHLATFDSNHALYEGGAMYATGSASLTINETTVTECTAQSGGGIATRGESVLTLKENVAIRRCEAPTGLGGGILVAGASLTITVASRNQPVVVESNSARRGGGVAYMAIVTLEGESTTFVQKNRAADKGGGVYGFSSYAKLYVAAHHSVMIQENEADTDGGGIALGQGAQVTVAPPACSDKCLSVMRGNEQCNVECLTAGCNW
jgi:cysteine-rich repeat protein/predicted outer membrane repeat protein